MWFYRHVGLLCGSMLDILFNHEICDVIEARSCARLGGRVIRLTARAGAVGSAVGRAVGLAVGGAVRPTLGGVHIAFVYS